MCQLPDAARLLSGDTMRQFAQDIKSRIPTRDYLQRAGIAVDRNGFAICPLHGDHNKSMKVYTDPSRGWHCFGCGKGGSVIDLCMQMEGITFRQAVVHLDTAFGLGLPLTAKRTAADIRKANEAAAKLRRERQAQQDAIRRAEDALWQAQDSYLTVLQGVDDYRPKKPSDAISWAYAAALKKLPEVKDQYERALDRYQRLRGGEMIAASSIR